MPAAMPKKTDAGNRLFQALDDMLALRRELERENLPARRMQIGCGHLEAPPGAVPLIVQTPVPGLVQTRAEVERAAFAQFGREAPWPDTSRALLDALQARVEAPIVHLAAAFVRVAMHRGACVVTVGTRGKPGWTNQDSLAPAAFGYLESLAGRGGCLVDVVDPFEREREPPAPETARAITWADIHGKGVAEHALTLVKRPRERLILLLASHLHMSPDAINTLNLAQVTQKFGRDGRPRVYLKRRLVRKKVVAEALLHFRRRDREAFLDAGEPLFRTGKRTPSGRSRRLGAKAIAAVIARYAERALKAMPPAPPAAEPPPRPPQPPLFWVSELLFHRS